MDIAGNTVHIKVVFYSPLAAVDSSAVEFSNDGIAWTPGFASAGAVQGYTVGIDYTAHPFARVRILDAGGTDIATPQVFDLSNAAKILTDPDGNVLTDPDGNILYAP